MNGSAWGVLDDRRTIVGLDPSTGRTEGPVESDLDVTSLGAAGRDLWVGLVDESERYREEYGQVARVDLAAGRLDAAVVVDSPPVAIDGDGAGRLWLVRNADDVVRFDPSSGGLLGAGPVVDGPDGPAPVGWSPEDLDAAGDSVWVAGRVLGSGGGARRRRGRRGGAGARRRVPAPRGPDRCTDDSVWLVLYGHLVRVDRRTDPCGRPRAASPCRTALGVTDEHVWVVAEGRLRRSSPDDILESP